MVNEYLDDKIQIRVLGQSFDDIFIENSPITL